ncbi:phage antirepressor KilAC domain-containing protein [Macrococcus brunensis]|uniref:phage antirepressor KilAC domain-containing protein n=1 Tax=Macrococcus brunensis TaxID=198483 RepID=UPI001EF0A133|nr:phage regulatory protein/antirepressor Ant [Macrococcus brunensis]ULG72979.1 phage regulatory protein/antirepressor Ant [Macrococcus brunensis]
MNLVKIENNTDLGPVVSSRTVAEELGRQHKHILDGLDKLKRDSTADISALLFESTYKASNGKSNREYLLTKDGFTLYMFNIQGHNDFKMAYINRFNEMEKSLQKVLPGSYKEALLQLVEQVEANEQLQIENTLQKAKIGELQPKADYVDEILKSPGAITITQIAADYGLSARKLNAILHKAKLQRKVGEQWVLYAPHMNKGYVKSHTIDIVRSNGQPDTKPQTRWTQKGRLKIHEIMTGLGYEAFVTADDQLAN